jgi:GNAT superfamily N-acetyltransferase
MSKFLLTSTNNDIAAQIASLLNLGGQLFFNQTRWSVIGNSIIYVVEMSYDQVAGVIGLEVCTPQVTEMKHLCVHPDHRRKGLGLKLLKKGIEYATTPLVYGAIRSDNATNLRNNFRVGLKPIAKHRGRGCHIIIFAGRRENIGHGLYARRA